MLAILLALSLQAAPPLTCEELSMLMASCFKQADQSKSAILKTCNEQAAHWGPEEYAKCLKDGAAWAQQRFNACTAPTNRNTGWPCTSS